MNASFPVDNVILVAAALLGLGVIVDLAANRVRVSGLLALMALGMVIADDGLALIRFDDVALAQNIAVVALAVILFEGGLGTTFADAKPVLGPAGMLGTVGVFVTAAVVGGVCDLVLGLPTNTAWLLGAVVASTDAASVFGALRGQPIPRRAKQLLQLESGGNDPVAVMMTVGIVEAWRSGAQIGDWVSFGAIQLGGGLLVGALVGEFVRRTDDKLRISSASTSAVLALSAGGVAYGLAASIGASGFLAVYVAGIFIAHEERMVRPLRAFHESLATTAQAGLFLILGMLVFPSELPAVFGKAVVVTLVLLLLARPAAVLVCLPWFGFRPREMTLVAWAGLRGAVPIVLATLPLTAGHPDGVLVFEVVFVVVIVSLLLQATTVSAVARRLGLLEEETTTTFADVLPVESSQANVAELHLQPGAAVIGHRLAQAPLPADARVAIMRRDGAAFSPTGATELLAGDVLMIVIPPGSEVSDFVDWASQPPQPPQPPSPPSIDGR